MRVSCAVILSTYNQPQWLEKALDGYAVQTERAFALIVADDGSRPDTAHVIERAQTAGGLDIRHVWHEDAGFRKCEILNKAILTTQAEYVIFSDGDCIPRSDFVATHIALAEPGRFLSGGVIWLERALSERITSDDVRSGRMADADWLRANGWNGGHALRTTQRRWLARALDALTPTAATFNGHNASVWRSDLLRVNGFDATMGYGGEDRAVGERLHNIGVHGRQVRHRACLFHLDHDRPYKQTDVMRSNREARARIVKERDVRAKVGIAEIAAQSGLPL